MTRDAGNVRYSLHEPFEEAIESVSASLRDCGLKIAGEIDVSRRVERTLGIALRPCRILFVLPGESLPRATAIHPWTGVLLPLHVVVSGCDAGTEVQIQTRVQPGEGAAETLGAPIAETQARIAGALQAVAVRPSMMV
ncbi:MAG: hypothetical protein KGN36_15830 [Acidobacteriota bacterium]|nr:hypothetical protein [Acidobacteriota bacterium]